VCAQYDTPKGVAFSFHICLYSIEPTFSNRAFNLLANDALRAALADEIEECGPEVPLVSLGESFACITEWLARATPCPNRSSCGPSGEGKGETPSGDAGEKVTLSVSGEFMRLDF
jgi:hypothetical protein